MKLLIISHTVVKGGKIKERGEIHDTQVDVENRKSDKEAFELIAAGRALDLDTEEAQEMTETIKREKAKAESEARAVAGKK